MEKNNYRFGPCTFFSDMGSYARHDQSPILQLFDAQMSMKFQLLIVSKELNNDFPAKILIYCINPANVKMQTIWIQCVVELLDLAGTKS